MCARAHVLLSCDTVVGRSLAGSIVLSQPPPFSFFLLICHSLNLPIRNALQSHASPRHMCTMGDFPELLFPIGLCGWFLKLGTRGMAHQPDLLFA